MRMWTAGAVAALLAAGSAELGAQRIGARVGAGPMMGPGVGIERIMSLREDLQLTEAQIAELEAIRQESVERRTSHRAQIEDIESRLRAGQIDRAAFREQVQALREGSAGTGEAERERVQGVLTEAQRESLDDVVGRGRAFAAGRASAMRRGPGAGMGPGACVGCRGMRGARGFGRDTWRRGGFGPGMAPRGWGPMRRGPRLPGGETPG